MTTRDQPPRGTDGKPRVRGVTRRAVLGGMAAAGASLTLGCSSSSQAAPSFDREADVVIVGGGLAGLVAARTLAAQNLSVVVLEARDRVGGRTLNQDLGPNGFSGRVVEMGGQYVGPLPGQPPLATVPGQEVEWPQDKIFGLAAELGIDTFKTYNTGDYLNYAGGLLLPYSSATRIPPDLGALNAGVAIGLLNQMAANVPIAAPWNTPMAAELDGETVESWMRRTLPPPSGPDAPTNHLITLALEAVLSVEPREVSLLRLLFYIASAGNLDNLVNTANGGQDSRFIGGSQAIAIALAAALGDSVVLNAPARRIEHDASSVTVRGESFTVTAKRAIVAVPLPLAGRIVYDPPLADLGARGFLREQLTQRHPMASILKVNVLYDRPFWRDAGLAGQVTSDTGAVRVTFDNTPYPDPGTTTVSPGVLMGFIEADEARIWSTATREERYAKVIDDLATYFGPQARSPLGGIGGYYEMVWNREQFSTGGPTANHVPGAIVEYGSAIRDPLGLLHWAGTETATRWTGYMDGAVESGERAAQEVLNALGS